MTSHHDIMPTLKEVIIKTLLLYFIKHCLVKAGTYKSPNYVNNYVKYIWVCIATTKGTKKHSKLLIQDSSITGIFLDENVLYHSFTSDKESMVMTSIVI